MTNLIPPLSFFLSSTVSDLKDVRGALRHYLSNELQVRVLACEEPSFPVEVHSDTLNNCIKNVSISDAVVLIIDRNYGASIRGSGDDPPMSFTRTEYRAAKRFKKPILIFVRAETLRSEQVFRKVISEKRKLGASVGSRVCASLLKEIAPEIETPLLLDFLTELRANGEWIQSFQDSSDLIEALEARMSTLLQEFRLLSGVSYRLMTSPSQAIEPIHLNRLVDRSQLYRGTNEEISRLTTPSNQRTRTAALWHQLRLGELRAQSVSDFVSMEVRNIMSAGQEDRYMRVLDSSMEAIGPDVWSGSVHARIVEASKQSSTKYGLRDDRHVRVSVLFDAKHYLSDIDQGMWCAALRRHIENHRRLRIKLGVVAETSLVSAPYGQLHNFYIVPGSRLEIFDVNSGLALGYSMDSDKELYDEFNSFFDQVISICNEGSGGFWIDDGMTMEEIISTFATISAS